MPKSVVPGTVMPAYPWLFHDKTDFAILSKKLSVMKTLGVPYSDKEVELADTSAREQALAVFDLEAPFTPLRLKARYKMMVKEHHPDAHGGDKAAEEKLKIINQAYATLKASYIN